MVIFAYTGLFNQVYAKRNEVNIRQGNAELKCNDDLLLHTQADKFNPFL